MNEKPNSSPSEPSVATPALDDLSRALDALGAHAPFRTEAGVALASQTEAGDCPELGAWLRLASGEIAPAEQQSLLTHAALCTACLIRMRECQSLASRQFTAEEILELEQLASATPAWRHRFAVELAHTPHQGNRRDRLRIFAWATGAAAALAMVLVAVVWWQRDNAPERLLAEAYVHGRPFELRLPGAAFAPVMPPTHLRGSDADVEPAQLFAARARIERQLERTPADPHWVQMEARAQILEERYDAAIDNLDRLLAAGPVTASLLADDGMAYYLRGVATGSENDRATALDTLHRADELAPKDPVVLFNEAVVMEDRGQIINAVETWNRFLQCERDPEWQAEGRRHLSGLQQKLDRLKSHQSRMEHHLATPKAMRALAADAATLASIDEELSTIFLPQLLHAAYPLPVDRSRGSPCADNCLAARSLLHALAASLEHNHQDPWLTRFLPPDNNSPTSFAAAAHALGQAIDADTRGDYTAAPAPALAAEKLFHAQGNAAGEARAVVEHAFALQRAFQFRACHQLLTHLDKGVAQVAWIDAQAVAVDAICDMDTGTATDANPRFSRALEQAQKHSYVLLALRARNALGGAAVESGDTETAWRFNIETLRKFYSGDYPAFRAGTTLGGLAVVEESTPRVHLALLVRRETYAALMLSGNRSIQAAERMQLVRAALRAGLLEEAQRLTIEATSDDARLEQGGSHCNQAETAISMAELYLDRHDLPHAARLLEQARQWMAGSDNPVLLRSYAVVRGEFELAQGHPEAAESTLRSSILKEELEAQGTGKQNVIFARQNRDLYATLAGVWLAQGRPGEDILALWERYRLRILGQSVRPCAGSRLDCLAPALRLSLRRALASGDRSQLLGQIVLRDRLLLYRAYADKVSWQQMPLPQTELLAAADALERVTSSPTTSEVSYDLASRRLGNLLLGDLRAPAPDARLLLEPDPLLGNLPWPAVAAADGPIGLRFALEETPSVLLKPSAGFRTGEGEGKSLLAIGASSGAGSSVRLPEALQEARMVAATSANSILLLAGQATEPQVAARLGSASIIHFAGHAAQSDGETRLLLAAANSSDQKTYLDRDLFLRNPPRAAQLAVFSACATGKKDAGWNHGMGDIVDTLASLGVPQVVATRWQIDSASAVPMMDAFYRGLAGGETVPGALSAARQSLLRDGRYRHPYYWAPYYASGTGPADVKRVFHGTHN